MAFFKAPTENGERIYPNIDVYQGRGTKLLPEFLYAAKSGTPEQTDMFTAWRVTEEIEKSMSAEKSGTIFGSIACGVIVIVSLGIVIYEILQRQAFTLVVIIPIILSICFLFCFIKVIQKHQQNTLELKAVCYAASHNNYSIMSYAVTEKHYYNGTDDSPDCYYLYCGELIIEVPMYVYREISVGGTVTAAIVNADGIEYFFTIGFKPADRLPELLERH